MPVADTAVAWDFCGPLKEECYPVTAKLSHVSKRTRLHPLDDARPAMCVCVVVALLHWHISFFPPRLCVNVCLYRFLLSLFLPSFIPFSVSLEAAFVGRCIFAACVSGGEVGAACEFVRPPSPFIIAHAITPVFAVSRQKRTKAHACTGGRMLVVVLPASFPSLHHSLYAESCRTMHVSRTRESRGCDGEEGEGGGEGSDCSSERA